MIASEQFHPAAQCQGKRRHSTFAEAKRATKRSGGSIYRCPYCRDWHVGFGFRKPGRP